MSSTPSTPIRVAIADDHKVVRVGLQQLLGTFEGVESVGAASGGAEAVELCGPSDPMCCCSTSRCLRSTASR